MIQYNIFMNRLTQDRCIKNNFRLSNNEYLISSKSFPNLYQRKFDIKEGDYLKVILSFIHKYNRDIINLPLFELNKIQKFYNIILSSEEKYTNERLIHLYIFLFWQKLDWNKNIIKNHNKNNLFYEGQIFDKSDKFQKNLLPYISNKCDLIYYEKAINTIKLIEIKNVDLDDRAISQIQRYYRKTNFVCETYLHNLQILHLKPILIIKHKNIIKDKTYLLQYWLTFPTYFRELLQIYSFSYCKENETLKLTNLKPKLKALIKGG